MWKIACDLLLLLLFLLLPVCCCLQLPVCSAEKQKRRPSNGVLSPGWPIRRRLGFKKPTCQKSVTCAGCGRESANSSNPVCARTCNDSFWVLGSVFYSCACSYPSLVCWICTRRAVKVFTYNFCREYDSIFIQKLSNCAIWEHWEAEVARQQTLTFYADDIFTISSERLVATATLYTCWSMRR